MAEPKTKPIQGRLGFDDPDIKKPAHDEMIKWLDANIEDILMVVQTLPTRPKGVRTKWQPLVQMKAKDGQFIGFADLIAFQSLNDLNSPPILFEALVTIESLGMLFRRLRMFQAGYAEDWHVSKMKFVVVCPDDTEAQTIREQGFYFLKYDPKMPFPAGGV